MNGGNLTSPPPGGRQLVADAAVLGAGIPLDGCGHGEYIKPCNIMSALQIFKYISKVNHKLF